MIADWDTDSLFLADRLADDDPALLTALRRLLSGVAIGTIPDARDVWCRDFMPVQLDAGRFCQFTYSPDYLRGHEQLLTPPERCRLPFMDNYHREPIVLDGGNVVASRARVILTDKLYRENPGVERSRLRERLEQLFQAECLVIPKEPYDPVGHVDGVVRFASEGRVLVNDYSGVDPGYGARLRKLLERKGLVVETLPMFQEKSVRRPGRLPSAVGLYINFLRVGDVVLLPGYDRPEDQLALEKVQKAIPNAAVFQVPCRALAEKGGVLNCISWTIRRERAVPV